jgi:RHS repeat-associated protein
MGGALAGPTTVSLTSPANNAVFATPASVTLDATATPGNGVTIKQVAFYQGATLIGTDTTAPYNVTWSNAPAGTYSLTAKATDSRNKITTSAAVSIVVSAPPTVSLTAPAANAVFNAPGTIALTANAADSDGTIAKVEFYQGATLIGTATAAPYTVTWNNVPAGSYSLTAKATDNRGIATTSTAVPIIVNVPPTVTLSSPTANQTFATPATVTLTANAADSDGTIAKVDFYQGATLIGTATTAPYAVTWNSVPAGSHILTAKATDDRGAVTTSAAVPIFVDTPPTVTLTSPLANAVFNPPATITLTASAADSDGTVAKVDFYQGATLIGTATAAPYAVTWNNVPAGSYSLTARATDDKGIVTTSPVVPVVVNMAPSVAITSPAPGASLTAPATVSLAASATDSDGTIARVEFYQGATLVGTATAAPYAVTWNNVPAGNYSLTAKATDNRGTSTTSSPVAITVRSDGATVIYLYSDHLNTPRLAMDEQNAVVWRSQPLAEPFGMSPPEEDPDGNGIAYALNLRFPGQYFDRESNLNYNYFRDYDPATGRYVQSDPIGIQGGINTYLYAEGNPLGNIDPLGLMGVAPGKGPYPPGQGPGSGQMPLPNPIPQSSCELVCRLTLGVACLGAALGTGVTFPPATPYFSVGCSMAVTYVCRKQCNPPPCPDNK